MSQREEFGIALATGSDEPSEAPDDQVADCVGSVMLGRPYRWIGQVETPGISPQMNFRPLRSLSARWQLTISRVSCVHGRSVADGGPKHGSMSAHWASVRSLGYRGVDIA